MTKRKLRKNADISPPQSPHDGIHTCSKGCTKCSRGLRDTIEEQDKQIEALKRDVLEKTAELRKSEEHNEALCERMQDLNSELHTCSCANANMHKYKNKNARLKAEVDLWKLRSDNWQKFCQLTRPEMTDELNRLKAEVERLTLENDIRQNNMNEMFKEIKEGREAYQSLHNRYMIIVTAKGVQS